MEIWKKTSFCKMLEVSNLGRARLSVTTKGNHKAGHVLSQIEKLGYMVVRVTIDGKRKHFFVHRLVCDAFNGKMPNGKEVCAHKDGNKKNNKPKNLYWATHMENIEDRERHGKTMKGDGHYNKKLNSKDIPKIRKMLKDGVNQTDIGNIFGVTNFTICDINRGKSWKNA